MFKNNATFFVCLLLAVATLASYWQTLHADFINYDDPLYVTENKTVQSGLNAENIVWAFTSGKANNWHPLTWLSHMLDCQLFGQSPFWHHLTSLIFHIANTLLLFFLLKRLTAAFWQSAFVAAVFALHPLHVQSVAWVAERKDVLSTLFLLLTIFAYAGYAARGKFWRYLLTLLLFAFGLMAKPMLVTVPLLLLLLDYWPLCRFKSKTILTLVLEKIPFLILAAASSFVTYIVQQGAVTAFETLSLTSRIFNAFNSYVVYVIKTFVPTGLAVYYSHDLIFPVWQVAVVITILLAITAAVFLIKRPWLIVGWFWYIITLLPVIGIIQVGSQARADRYMYIPMIGILIMIAWGLAELASKFRIHKIPLATAATACVIALFASTFFQVGYWKDSITLFTHAVEVTTDNHIAHLNLGNALIANDRVDEAIYHYRKTIEISDRFADAYDNLGIALCSQNKFDEAIKQFEAVIDFGKANPRIHFHLAGALAKKGLTDKAIEHYLVALKTEPNNYEFNSNYALALGDKGRLDEAIARFDKALESKPDSPEILSNKGNVLMRLRKTDQAVACFKKALELRPDFVIARYNYACALKELGKFNEAVEQYNLVLKDKGSNTDVYCGLGSTYAALKQTDKSVENYRKAIQLAPRNILAHGQLALLLASIGKTDEAIKEIRTVLAYVPNDAEMRCNLGILLQQQGKTAEAINEYKRSIQINNNSRASQLLSTLQQQLGK